MSIPSQRIIGLGGAGGKIANAVARVTAGRLAAAAVDTDFAAVSQLAAKVSKEIGDTVKLVSFVRFNFGE